jgi:hypothetical protein
MACDGSREWLAQIFAKNLQLCTGNRIDGRVLWRRRRRRGVGAANDCRLLLFRFGGHPDAD